LRSGQYPGTAGPGEIGNFAVTAHHASHGEPFANLDRVKPGDLVNFSIGDEHWSYQIDRTFLSRS